MAQNPDPLLRPDFHSNRNADKYYASRDVSALHGPHTAPPPPKGKFKFDSTDRNADKYYAEKADAPRPPAPGKAPANDVPGKYCTVRVKADVRGAIETVCQQLTAGHPSASIEVDAADAATAADLVRRVKAALDSSVVAGRLHEGQRAAVKVTIPVATPPAPKPPAAVPAPIPTDTPDLPAVVAEAPDEEDNDFVPPGNVGGPPPDEDNDFVLPGGPARETQTVAAADVGEVPADLFDAPAPSGE